MNFFPSQFLIYLMYIEPATDFYFHSDSADSEQFNSLSFAIAYAMLEWSNGFLVNVSAFLSHAIWQTYAISLSLSLISTGFGLFSVTQGKTSHSKTRKKVLQRLHKCDTRLKIPFITLLGSLSILLVSQPWSCPSAKMFGCWNEWRYMT